MGNVEIIAGADEQRLMATLEMAFDALVDVDSRGFITDWNSRAERLFGWPRLDAVGQHVDLIVPPRHREVFSSSLATAEDPLTMRALHRDGRRFSAELFFCPQGSGEDFRITIFVRSLVEREQLQKLSA